MILRHVALALALAALSCLQTALAQMTVEDALDQLSECSINCLVTVVGASDCEITDVKCIGGDLDLQSDVEDCALAECTVKEALQLKSIASQMLGAPVRDRSKGYEVITIAFGVVAGAFVIMRFGFKLVAKLPFMIDDWLTLATIVVGTPSTILSIHGATSNGLGKDIWTLPYDHITKFAKSFYIMSVLYFACVALIKLAFLFFYLRIFPYRTARILLWGTVVFTTIYGAVFVLIAAFQCRPVEHVWLKWDGTHPGKCISINNVSWVNAAIGIALDFWMLAIPLWHIKHIKLNVKRKIGVAMMFSVGIFITIVSIVRLRALISFSHTKFNVTWAYVDVASWSTIEINVGLICVCMPTLRLLISSIWPAAFGSTQRSDPKYSSSAGRSARSAKRFSAMPPRDTVDSVADPHSYPLPNYPPPVSMGVPSVVRPQQAGVVYGTVTTAWYSGSDEEIPVKSSRDAKRGFR